MKPEVINSGNGLELEISRHLFSLWEFWIFKWEQVWVSSKERIFDDDFFFGNHFLFSVYLWELLVDIYSFGDNFVYFCHQDLSQGREVKFLNGDFHTPQLSNVLQFISNFSKLGICLILKVVFAVTDTGGTSSTGVLHLSCNCLKSQHNIPINW